jgi:fumarate reductase flavoprotein subunit
MTLIRTEHRVFEAHVPVLVVGAGACGASAALAARDAGVDVLMLERDPRPFGSTAMSLGAICGCATREQRQHDVQDSPDLLYADILAKTEGRADAPLARVLADECGPTLDWLGERHRVPLRLDFAWTGLGHSRPRLHLPPGRSGEELLSLLHAAAARAGAGLLTEAHVDALYATTDDRVLGVRVRRPGGGVEEVGCDALVLATCGFGANRAMIATHIPEMAGARYFGHEGNEGEGIAWGRELGAAVGDMTAYQGLGTLAEPHAIIVPHPLLLEGGVLLNVEGRRFVHENGNISGLCVPVLAQPRGLAWVWFDGERLAASLAHSPELRQCVEAGAVRTAATLDELCAACGLPADAVRATLDEVRRMNAGTATDTFGRDFRNVRPLEPPYHAIRVTGALFHTQGGLQIDGRGRVLRADGQPLPNLYAGGGAARGVSGPAVTGYLPAMGLSMAVTFGRLAGDAAARATLAPHEGTIA